MCPYRHTDKDESFCLTVDKFFTRPLSTQPYQWGGDLPIAVGPPSRQPVLDRVRGDQAVQAFSKHHILQRRNPSSYCAVSHPTFPPIGPYHHPWPPAWSHGFGSLLPSPVPFCPTGLLPLDSIRRALRSALWTPDWSRQQQPRCNRSAHGRINKRLMSCHVHS
jgi:hypothetical protein